MKKLNEFRLNLGRMNFDYYFNITKKWWQDSMPE